MKLGFWLGVFVHLVAFQSIGFAQILSRSLMAQKAQFQVSSVDRKCFRKTRIGHVTNRFTPDPANPVPAFFIPFSILPIDVTPEVLMSAHAVFANEAVDAASRPPLTFQTGVGFAPQGVLARNRQVIYIKDLKDTSAPFRVGYYNDRMVRFTDFEETQNAAGIFVGGHELSEFTPAFGGRSFIDLILGKRTRLDEMPSYPPGRYQQNSLAIYRVYTGSSDSRISKMSALNLSIPPGIDPAYPHGMERHYLSFLETVSGGFGKVIRTLTIDLIPVVPRIGDGIVIATNISAPQRIDITGSQGTLERYLDQKRFETGFSGNNDLITYYYDAYQEIQFGTYDLVSERTVHTSQFMKDPQTLGQNEYYDLLSRTPWGYPIVARNDRYDGRQPVAKLDASIWFAGGDRSSAPFSVFVRDLIPEYDLTEEDGPLYSKIENMDVARWPQFWPGFAPEMLVVLEVHKNEESKIFITQVPYTVQPEVSFDSLDVVTNKGYLPSVDGGWVLYHSDDSKRNLDRPYEIEVGRSMCPLIRNGILSTGQ